MPAFPRSSRARAALLACVAMALLSPRAAGGVPETATAAPVIPPGQEELVAAMLGRGATLPVACTFVGGEIARAVVRGVYDCAGAEVALELRHPSAAPDAAPRTEKIAIVTARGTPPAALVAAITERIREREGAFEWLRPKLMAASTRAPGCASAAPLPGVLETLLPGCYPLAAALLVGAAQTLVIVLGLACGVRRLSRRPRAPTAA